MMDYILNASKEFDLTFKDNDMLNITLCGHTSGTLSIHARGEGNLRIEVTAEANSQWKILWINHSESSLKIVENFNVFDEAELKIVYGELSTGSHEKNTKIHLNGVRSHVEVIGAVLAFGNLAWSMQADHKARHSVAHLNTNAIILDKAHLKMEVEGKISKGYNGSKTHQMTRILNLGEQTEGVVFPKLLIDENDVEASHAASVGQANEEHIYYLQSRGLTKIEALRLMIKGYLIPVINEIDNEPIREALMNEIETKVNAYVK